MIKGRFNDIYGWFMEVFDINVLCVINVTWVMRSSGVGCENMKVLIIIAALVELH